MKKTIILPLLLCTASSLSAQTALSLQDCREMALRNSTHVKNAYLDVLAASAQKQEVLAEYFPKVSLNSFGFIALDPMLEIGVKDVLGESGFSTEVQAAVDYLGARFGFPSVFTAFKSGYSASVTALQPVYAGGRIINADRLASLGKEASVLQSEITSRNMLENVDKDYWTVVVLQEKMKTLDSSEAFLEKLYEDVSAAFGAGLALDTDLMQVELRLNELMKLRLSLIGGLRLAKMALFDSIGQEYSVVKGLDSYIDDISLSGQLTDFRSPEYYYVTEEEMVSELAEMNLLDLAIEGKRLEKKMLVGEALPQLAVGASYGYARALNSRFNGLVFATVKIPLSDWGKVSRRMQRQDYALQKAWNDKEYSASQLLLLVRSLWLDLNVAWDNIGIARDGMELARMTVFRMADQYEAGLVTLSDLMQSQMQLRISTDSYHEALSGYATALSAYLSRQ